jgi:hypothetical protein
VNVEAIDIRSRALEARMARLKVTLALRCCGLMHSVRGEAALGATKPGQKLDGGTIAGRNGKPPVNSILFHVYDHHFLD